MKLGYVPDAGDVVWLEFDPQAGHEQGGRRPALTLTPATYNGRTGMMLCCLVTTRIKGYPFEVKLTGRPPSVVLADQVKSQGWRARSATFKGKAKPAELAQVKALVRTLIG